jgi:hypothetical protein
MYHQKAIVKMSGLIDHYFCDRVVDYLRFEDLQPMKIFGDRIKENTRNVLGTTCSFDQAIKDISNEDMTKYVLYKHLLKKLELVLLNYQVMFKNFTYQNVVQSDFLKYNEGGKYEVHVDGSGNVHRILSIILNLNDEYEGGEFQFFNPQDNKEIIREEKLKKGEVLCFPSNFMYPHSVRPITKGNRYSIVSWTI